MVNGWCLMPVLSADDVLISVGLPVLFQVVLPLEGLAADLTRKCHVILVTALVDHQVVGLGEAALAVLADKFTLGSHFAAKLPPVVTLYLHNREHGGRCPLLAGSSHYSLESSSITIRVSLRTSFLLRLLSLQLRSS